MFYCDPCAKENGYPESMGKSEGKCEMCGEWETCNNVPSSHLPKPDKLEPEVSFDQYECGEEVSLPLEGFGKDKFIAMNIGDRIMIMSKMEDSNLVNNIVYVQDKRAGEKGYRESPISKRFIDVNIENGIFKQIN